MARVPFALLALILAPTVGPLTLCQAQDGSNSKGEVDEADARLAKVKRVCIQSMGSDALGVQVQEMVIAKLFQSKRFSLTENCDKAEFVIKGSVTERNEHVSRSESEGIGFGQGASGSSSSSSRVAGSASSSSASGSARISGNAYENLSSSEVKQEAAVTLRIVDKEGEIIWATSQETAEGKSKGAIGLAAELAVRRLLKDISRAEKSPSRAK